MSGSVLDSGTCAGLGGHKVLRVVIADGDGPCSSGGATGGPSSSQQRRMFARSWSRRPSASDLFDRLPIEGCNGLGDVSVVLWRPGAMLQDAERQRDATLRILAALARRSRVDSVVTVHEVRPSVWPWLLWKRVSWARATRPPRPGTPPCPDHRNIRTRPEQDQRRPISLLSERPGLAVG